MQDIIKRIEYQLLDGEDFERNYNDFKTKRQNYLSDSSIENRINVKLAYAKVYEDIKLCKVGHTIKEEEFFEMTEYLANLENPL